LSLSFVLQRLDFPIGSQNKVTNCSNYRRDDCRQIAAELATDKAKLAEAKAVFDVLISAELPPRAPYTNKIGGKAR
jgi:hypothetical protein